MCDITIENTFRLISKENNTFDMGIGLYKHYTRQCLNLLNSRCPYCFTYRKCLQNPGGCKTSSLGPSPVMCYIHSCAVANTDYLG